MNTTVEPAGSLYHVLIPPSHTDTVMVAVSPKQVLGIVGTSGSDVGLGVPAQGIHTSPWQSTVTSSLIVQGSKSLHD